MDVYKDNTRHICLVCKRKKAAYKMVKYRSHWSCVGCLSTDKHELAAYKDENPDERSTAQAAGQNELPGVGSQVKEPGNEDEKAGTKINNRRDDILSIKVLNLYCGVGGNRRLWPQNIQVTAVEHDPKIAAEYKRLYPNDIVIVGDAHKYLLKHYNNFDFIWSSPPCQSHTKFNEIRKNRYPDMSLYQEIILLRNWHKGKYVIENVNPYYDELIKPARNIGRHLFWSNFKINPCYVEHLPGLFDFGTVDDKKYITEWLGFDISVSLYSTSKNSLQVLRNCVHPKIGLSIFNDFIASLKR